MIFLENEKIEYWLLYKVQDKFPYKQKNKKIVKVEYIQNWFASFVSSHLRDYLKSSGAIKIKYGSFTTEKKQVAEGFKAVAENIKETLETSLFHSKRLADKKKNLVRSEKVQARIDYLKTHYEKRIKPSILVLKIKRVAE